MFTTTSTSSFINKITGNVLRGTVLVEMKNGNSYIYDGVSRRALAKLAVCKDTSLGFFFNQHVKPANLVF